MGIIRRWLRKLGKAMAIPEASLYGMGLGEEE
jgi:hypothetical protein